VPNCKALCRNNRDVHLKNCQAALNCRFMDTATELRREERITAVLPVLFLGGRGTTQNVSASGMYIETEHPLALGTEVDLIIEFASHAGGPLRVKCSGSILRTVEHGGSQGMAAAIRWDAR
jgi:hypothetical protein